MNDYLSIFEFSKAANVSKQAIYKRLNTGLKPYVKKINGQKMISKEALNLYNNVETTVDNSTDKTTVENKVETTVEKTVNSTVENLEKSTDSTDSTATEKSTADSTVENKVDSTVENQQLIMLNKTIDLLSKQLEQKDKQIDELNDRLAEAFKTIDSQTVLINQQQHLSLIDKKGTIDNADIVVDIEEANKPKEDTKDKQEEHKGFFSKLFNK